MDKLISPGKAAGLIKDGDCIGIGGFVGLGIPEELTIALEKRFKATNSPKGLTLVYAAG